jgi:hypothetical protein
VDYIVYGTVSLHVLAAVASDVLYLGALELYFIPLTSNMSAMSSYQYVHLI